MPEAPTNDPLGALPKLDEALKLFVSALLLLPRSERKQAATRFYEKADEMLSQIVGPV
jgi:hypothetical protein